MHLDGLDLRYPVAYPARGQRVAIQIALQQDRCAPRNPALRGQPFRRDGERAVIRQDVSKGCDAAVRTTPHHSGDHQRRLRAGRPANRIPRQQEPVREAYRVRWRRTAHPQERGRGGDAVRERRDCSQAVHMPAIVSQAAQERERCGAGGIGIDIPISPRDGAAVQEHAANRNRVARIAAGRVAEVRGDRFGVGTVAAVQRQVLFGCEVHHQRMRDHHIVPLRAAHIAAGTEDAGDRQRQRNGERVHHGGRRSP